MPPNGFLFFLKALAMNSCQMVSSTFTMDTKFLTYELVEQRTVKHRDYGPVSERRAWA